MKHKILLLLFVLIIHTIVLKATNYYVSPSGSDSNSGTSTSAPFATIQKAVTTANSGNDVIYLMSGTYNQMTNISSKNGITITNYSGASPVLDATGASYTVFFMISNASNITISGLKMQNLGISYARGIYVYEVSAPASSNLTFSNNTFTEINSSSTPYTTGYTNPNSGANAILVAGGIDNSSNAITNVIITGNTVQTCELGFSEGISVKGNVNGFLIANNTVQDVSDIGIDAAGLESWPTLTNQSEVAQNGVIRNNTVINCIDHRSGSDNGAIYVDGGSNINILYNTVSKNKFGINIGCENQIGYSNAAANNIQVRDNYIYNNTLSGILVGTNGSNTVGGYVTNSVLEGNTLYMDADSSGSYDGELYLQYNTNLLIRDNIFYIRSQNGTMYQMGNYGVNITGLTLGYNDYYPGGSNSGVCFSDANRSWNAYSLVSMESTYGISDPGSVFGNPTLTGYQISTSSSCVNAGDPNFVGLSGETDYSGDTRIQGGHVDIGCYETGGAVNNPNGVSVSPTSESISVNGTEQLTSTVTPSSASQTVTWSSSNTSIATVNSSGLVTGVAAGSAIITSTTTNNLTATSTVTVTATVTSPTGVSVSPTSESISVNGTEQLTSTVTPSSASQTVTWSSSNTSIATVNSSGLVTGVAAGTTTITATTSNNLTSTCTITVTATSPTGVSVSPNSATITINGTQQLTSTVTPSNANQSVTWSSSNTSIATVNSSGLVTGVAVGSATITATTTNNLTATSAITVNATAGGLPAPWQTTDIGAVETTGSASYSSGLFTVNGSGWDIYGNTDAFRFVYQQITTNGQISAEISSITNPSGGSGWSKAGVMIKNYITATSGYALVAVTPSNGVILETYDSTTNITGQIQVIGIVAPIYVELVRSGSSFTGYYSSNGTSWSTIGTATVNGLTTSSYIGMAVTAHDAGVICTSTISNVIVSTGVAPTGISVSPTSASIALTGTEQLTATVTPSGASQGVTWSSSNTSVATVSASGLVTGVATGTVTITATTSNNLTATCTITVTSITPTGVTVSPTTSSISVNGTQQLTSTVTPSGASQAVTWSSSNTSVATVSSSGLVTGIATGTTTITAKTTNNLTASSLITVTTITPTGVTVSPTSSSISINGTQQLTATVTPSGSSQTVTWSSGNISVATVSSTGLVTGVASGTVMITVRTSTGDYQANCNITVTSSSNGLPSPWQTSDIGAVGATGSATYSSGAFTLNGSGWDIYGNTDAFRFVYQPISTNAQIQATVTSMTNPSGGGGWSKAGVMIKGDILMTSGYAICAITPSNGVILETYDSTTNETSQIQITGIVDPQWVALERSGTSFTGYYSSNGVNWTTIGTSIINGMSSNYQIGMAVTSHDAGTLCTTSIDNVTITLNGEGGSIIGPIPHISNGITNLNSLDSTRSVSNDIFIYPNPFKDNLNINLENSTGLAEIKIYTLEGSLIYEVQTYDNFISINMNNLNLNSGMLIVQISKNNQVSNFKVFKN